MTRLCKYDIQKIVHNRFLSLLSIPQSRGKTQNKEQCSEHLLLASEPYFRNCSSPFIVGRDFGGFLYRPGSPSAYHRRDHQHSRSRGCIRLRRSDRADPYQRNGEVELDEKAASKVNTLVFPIPIAMSCVVYSARDIFLQNFTILWGSGVNYTFSRGVKK
ncbi:MAG: hypothetical protein NTY81_03110 [Candidatus Staskawiczbacteria bacterium]|nr:hypothetical protein [Candidatus Staskawiczbacteria bacterium]